MRSLGIRVLLAAMVVAVPGTAARLFSAEVSIRLPLVRTAYQTNEPIDVAVVRVSDGSLLAGDLVLAAAGDDGSRAEFTFPVSAVPARDGAARRTEHLHLNGRLLRPGRYTIRVAADGAAATTRIELFTHVRKQATN